MTGCKGIPMVMAGMRKEVNQLKAQFYLDRNGQKRLIRNETVMMCPLIPDTCCTEKCPAFNHIPATGRTPARVELKCFPQVVEFEIEEKAP
jgi:hypothetical protein